MLSPPSEGRTGGVRIGGPEHGGLLNQGEKGTRQKSHAHSGCFSNRSPLPKIGFSTSLRTVHPQLWAQFFHNGSQEETTHVAGYGSKSLFGELGLLPGSRRSSSAPAPPRCGPTAARLAKASLQLLPTVSPCSLVMFRSSFVGPVHF